MFNRSFWQRSTHQDHIVQEESPWAVLEMVERIRTTGAHRATRQKEKAMKSRVFHWFLCPTYDLRDLFCALQFCHSHKWPWCITLGQKSLLYREWYVKTTPKSQHRGQPSWSSSTHALSYVPRTNSFLATRLQGCSSLIRDVTSVAPFWGILLDSLLIMTQNHSKEDISNALTGQFYSQTT